MSELVTSRYRVIYVEPRPGSCERINIGVIVESEDRRAARFIKAWGPLDAFGVDTAYLKSLADTIRHELETQGELDLDELRGFRGVELLDSIVPGSPGRIGITNSQTALMTRDRLLERVASTFLMPSPVATSQSGIDKRQAIRDAKKGMKQALHSVIGDSYKDYIKPQTTVKGSMLKHPVDMVVGNGIPVLGMWALSFQDTDRKRSQKDASAALGTVVDLREVGIVSTIYMVPPTRMSHDYEVARDGFRGENAVVIEAGRDRFEPAALKAYELIMSH